MRATGPMNVPASVASAALLGVLVALAGGCTAIRHPAPGAAAVPASSVTDFSGTWILDHARGDAAALMPGLRLTSRIRQDRTEVLFEERFDDRGTITVRRARYDLTGAAARNETARGPADAVARWEGARLVVTWTAPGAPADSADARIETRSLSADGRTMTVQSRRPGAEPVTLVFARQ